MTRITNFGRKRTYLEAGFAKEDKEEAVEADLTAFHAEEPKKIDADAAPMKKARKRQRKSKDATGTEEKDVESNEESKAEAASPGKEGMTGIKRQLMEERQSKQVKSARSEQRRLKRIAERHADTTCLACRKKGHIMKDCPEAGSALDNEVEEGTNAASKPTVGICYRCGSKKHSLSRCKRPENLKNPLPFASCFVCSRKGHLSSKCPQNAAKGIYPNGGSCKLCQQTDHLAKDCPLRTKEMAAKQTLLLNGPIAEAGPDEDDFHVLKRRRDVVQKEENTVKKLGDKTLAPPKPKPKVVVFK